MRRSDIGPFGVVALIVVLLLQITALASIPAGWPGAAAAAEAVVTGRVAVVLATGPASPAARPDGKGMTIHMHIHTIDYNERNNASNPSTQPVQNI